MDDTQKASLDTPSFVILGSQQLLVDSPCCAELLLANVAKIVLYRNNATRLIAAHTKAHEGQRLLPVHQQNATRSTLSLYRSKPVPSTESGNTLRYEST